MTRVPPSASGKPLTACSRTGLMDEADVTSVLMRLRAQRVGQELLEQEVTDHLERSHYQRAEVAAGHRGY